MIEYVVVPLIIVSSILLYYSFRPMRTLYIIRGLPGSGKSTLAYKMSRELNASFHETDDYLYNEDGDYEWSQERLSVAIEKCRNDVYSDMESRRKDVIVAGVFGRWSAMRDYVDMAYDHGYRVEIIRCIGDYGSVHEVPVEKLDQMRRNFVPNSALPRNIDIKYTEYKA